MSLASQLFHDVIEFLKMADESILKVTLRDDIFGSET